VDDDEVGYGYDDDGIGDGYDDGALLMRMIAMCDGVS
jgi:hypothetical protein